MSDDIKTCLFNNRKGDSLTYKVCCKKDLLPVSYNTRNKIKDNERRFTSQVTFQLTQIVVRFPNEANQGLAMNINFNVCQARKPRSTEPQLLSGGIDVHPVQIAKPSITTLFHTFS